MQTTFIPRENVFVLERWLQYHTALGCEHFYLYNNAGSRHVGPRMRGHGIEIDGRNKYGVNVRKLTKSVSDADIAELLARVSLAYNVTIIPWSPVEAVGGESRVMYGQGSAFVHVVQRYGRHHKWLGLLDMDEYVVPPPGRCIGELLAAAPTRAGRLTMHETRMLSHWSFAPPDGVYKQQGASPLSVTYALASQGTADKAVKSFLRMDPKLGPRMPFGTPHRQRVHGAVVDPWPGVTFFHFTGVPRDPAKAPRAFRKRTELKEMAESLGLRA